MMENINCVYIKTQSEEIFEGNISKEDFLQQYKNSIKDFTYGTGEVFIKVENGIVSELE